MQGLSPQAVSIFRRVFALLILGSLLATVALADKGSKLYKQAREAEVRNQQDQALVLYEQAWAAEPANGRYKLAVLRMRFATAVMHVERGQKLQKAGKLPEALQEFERAFAIDPSLSVAEQEIRRTLQMIEAARTPGGVAGEAPAPSLTLREQAEADAQRRLDQVAEPVRLTPPSRAPITLKAGNSPKVLYETVGRLAGINVLFDPDYPPGRNISLELNNVTLEQALDTIGVLSKSLWKPLTTNTIFVYAEAKRREYEQQVVKTFYVSNMLLPNELTELAQAIRNLLDATKIMQVTTQNAIVMRDTPDKIAIAEKIIHDIDKSRPEIVISVAVLQARRDRVREIGLFPGSPGLRIPIAFTPRGTIQSDDDGASTSTGSVTLKQLGRIGSGDFSIVVPGGALNLLLSDANTRLLQNPEIRASDGMPAKLRIGERIPIATGSFQPGIGGVGINPLVNTQFQYTDVGVNLDITPRVHGEEEVTLKVMVEVSSVTSRVEIGGISQPIIGQRRIEHDIRLKEGETNILGGIIEQQTEESLSGIPGLSQIPILKYFFSSTRNVLAENEVLIALTPHIVRLPRITALNMRGIDVGTGTNIQIRTRPEVTAPALPPGTQVSPPPGAPSGPSPLTTPPGEARPGTPPARPEAAPETERPAPETVPTPAVPPPGMAPAPQPQAETPPQPAEPEAAQPAVGGSLAFDSVVYSQPVGTAFQVDIAVQNARNIHSVPLQLHYNPKQIKIMNILHGGFLSQDGQAVAVVQRVDEAAGMATITLTRPPGTPGVSGSGTLASISFQAAAPGDSGMMLMRTAARTAAGQPVQMDGTQARVTVR